MDFEITVKNECDLETEVIEVDPFETLDTKSSMSNDHLAEHDYVIEEYSNDPSALNYAPIIFEPHSNMKQVPISGETLELDNWKDNPWAVKNFKDFLMFNCPECEFKTKEELKLMCHGLEKHINAKEYFKTNPTIYNQNDLPLEIVFNPSQDTQLTPIESKPIVKKVVKSKPVPVMKRNREKEEARTCKLCSHISPTYDEHKEHFRKCKHALGFYCQDCEYNTKYKHVLRKHYHLVHGKVKPGTEVCNLCGHVSYSKTDDRKHQLKTHSEKLEPVEKVAATVICDECGKSYRDAHVLNIHKDKMHQHIFLRTCKVCQEIFANIAEVYKHHRDNHPDESCSIIKDNVHVCECQICFKIFNSHHPLPTHYKRVHNLTGKELYKYHSGYNPNIKDAMKLQLKAAGISVEETQPNECKSAANKCDNCDRKFWSHGTKETHMKVCKEKPMTRKFANTIHKCDYCNKAFRHLGSLKIHATVCDEKPKD